MLDRKLRTELEQFQAAEKSDPSNLGVQFNIGLILLRTGQFKAALPHLQRAAADPSLVSEARYLLGTAYFAVGDYPHAAEALRDLPSPAQAEHVLYMLEESYRLTGKIPQARDTFRELNRNYPDSAWTHYLLGAAYENQAENEKAIAEYKAALEKNPTHPNASFAIGYIYWRDRNFDKATPWLQKELALQPCHSLAAYYLGEIARTSQDLKTSKDLFRRAIDCDNGNVKARVSLGIVLAALHEESLAIQEFQQAIRLDPLNPTPHYRLAVLYKELGRKKEANAEYARVKELQTASGQTVH